MPWGDREWNRARLVHPMLYSHLPYILFTAFFSESQNPSPGHSDAFREPFPASTRQSLPMVAAPGPSVVRGGEWLQYRARVGVIYVFTAPVRRFGRLCATISASGGGARRSKDGLSTGYQAFPTLPRTHGWPPRRLNDELMPHTDAVTALPRGTVSRQRGRPRPPKHKKRPRNAVVWRR